MKRRSLSILVVFGLLIAGGCLPAWATRPLSTVTIPASIDQSGMTDVSAAFQAFLDSVPNNSVAALRPGARYRMEQTLRIEDRKNLTIDGRGATIFATTPGNGTRSQVKVVHSQSIVITDLTVKGANPSAGMADAAFDLSKEHQHGFDIRGVVGLVLLRVAVSDTYGDFVYLGQDEERPGERRWTSDVVIRSSRFDRNGRMGVAMTAARNVLIEQSTFNQMRRSTFDMEAHDPGFGAEYVTIRNNDIGPGRLLLVASVGTGDVDHFRFEGNRVAGILNIRMHSGGGALRTDWKVLNNTARGVSGNPDGAVMTFDNIDGLEVRGNYQQVQTHRPMIGARAVDSCNVKLGGNTYPGAVSQGVVTGTC